MQSSIAFSENYIRQKIRSERARASMDSFLLTFCVIYCFVTHIVGIIFTIDNSFVMILISFSRVFFLFLLYCRICKAISTKLKITTVITFALFATAYLVHFSGLAYILETFLFILTLQIISVVQITRQQINICVCLLFLFVLLLICIAPRGDEKTLDGIIKVNPNTTAFILFLVFSVSISLFIARKSYIFLVIAIILFLFQIVFISRTAVIGIIIFLFSMLIFRCIKKKAKVKVSLIISLILILGIFFAYLYSIILFNIIGKGQIFIFGKDIFTGRQTIWADAFKQLETHWLFGIGNTLDTVKIEGQTEVGTNLHNQMMGYLTVFGLPCAAAFIIVVALSIGFLYRRKTNQILICCIFALFIMSYFDTIIYASANQEPIIIAIVIISSIKKYKKTSRHHIINIKN